MTHYKLILNQTVSYLIYSFIYEHNTQSKLQQRAQKCERFDLFTFFRTDLIQSEASCKLSSTSDRLISAWKNVI